MTDAPTGFESEASYEEHAADAFAATQECLDADDVS